MNLFDLLELNVPTELLIEYLNLKYDELNKQNIDGFSPLMTAIKENNLSAVTLFLLLQDCNTHILNNNKENILHLAIMYPNIFIFDYILNSTTIDINHQNNLGQTPLHFCCISLQKEFELFTCDIKQIELIEVFIKKMFLTKRCNLNIRDCQKKTPIFYILHDHKLVELFIYYGANLTMKNKNKRTPIEYAKNKGYNKTVEFLNSFNNFI